uniref:NADP-retinol dehydrogenase n=1 Tax=Glossina morsitans morsitans TaxID=37546 RepID=A0A1B0F9K2_GLOMM
MMLMSYIKFCLEEFAKLVVPKTETNVSDEVVLITSTGHGIGKELALQYADLGATLLCWDINESTNAGTVEQIKVAGGKDFDVKSVSLEDLATRYPQGSQFEASQQAEQQVHGHEFSVKLEMVQVFLPDVVRQNRGHIAALSSCAGLFGLNNLVPSCDTKYAVRGFMKATAEESRYLNPKNPIKMTMVYPYINDTGLCKKSRFRFSSMGLIKPQETVAFVIKTQRTGLEEISVPRDYFIIEKISNLFPCKAVLLLCGFLDIGVDSNL